VAYDFIVRGTLETCPACGSDVLSTLMALLSCPVCAKQFDTEQTPSRPFCSERCRQIDLGRWLSEKYTVPEMRGDPEDGEVGPQPPDRPESRESDEES